MRLLQYDNDANIILTKDFINDIPPYAILSHTWGPEAEEVTFRDVLDGQGQTKAGYRKLQFCGDQTGRDGLQYFWIDTCCIDKTNSTELAEAINSMFRWYHNAVRCYVYLSDVLRAASSTANPSNLQPWISQFRVSRWFTRGWTLQELVAPRTIGFFSREGDFLGDKRSLEQVIHEITRIPLDALRGDRTLPDFSVEERMSWAKCRSTTRQEDAAYCLLGIFDVYIPLIYGESQENALFRLRTAIVEKQGLSSVPLKDTPPAASSKRISDRQFKSFTSSLNDAPVDLLSTCLVERQRELGLIRKAHQVREDRVPSRCAVWGRPGVGKTQLALSYTKIFLDNAIVSAVFWIPCSDVEKLYQGFSRLLNLIDHPEQSEGDSIARMVRARNWLEQPEVSGIHRWLLVLDNVDITTLDFLRENLPRQGKQGRILSTTRTEGVARALCKVSGESQISFELEPPIMDDAIMLFLKSAGVSETSVSSMARRQITNLLGCLGCLPFAIDQAASFMVHSSQTIESFTRLYQSNQKPHIFNWQNLLSAYEVKSVSGMFQSHIHDLRKSNPEAYGLLNMLAFWDPDSIEFMTIKAGALFLGTSSKPLPKMSKTDHSWRWTPWFVSSLIQHLYSGLSIHNEDFLGRPELVEDVLPPSELEQLVTMMSSEVQLQIALHQLQMLSLIKRRSTLDRGAYSIHDLTKTLVQVALESEGTHLRWFKCSIKMACGTLRQFQIPSLPENRHQYEGLILHILSLARYSESIGVINADILRARGNIAAYWCDRGRYFEARETYQRLLDVDGNVLDDAGIEATQWKLGLAEVNWHLSKHDESALLYEQVLQVQKLQLGSHHPDVLSTTEKLALVYRSQARYREARSMLEHVLESRKTSLGPDNIETLRVIDSLAMTINEHAEAENHEVYFVEAEVLHKQALVGREVQLGADHLDTLWTADNLGTTYRAQGKYKEAVQLYERVLQGRTSQLGEDHPQVLWTVSNLASAYTSLHRFNEAEAMYRRSLSGNEQRLGRDHMQTLWVVEGLADVHHQQSDIDQARNLYDRALCGLKNRLGVEHPSTLRVMHKLANLYYETKDFSTAVDLFEEVLKLYGSRQETANPELLRAYHDAAAAYIGLGKYIVAEQCYRSELAGSIEIFGDQHAETKKREEYLATFLADTASHGTTPQDGVPGNVPSEEPPMGETNPDRKQS